MNGLNELVVKIPLICINGLSGRLLFFTKINMLIFAARPFTLKMMVNKNGGCITTG
jgi:hypothetical protein